MNLRWLYYEPIYTRNINEVDEYCIDRLCVAIVVRGSLELQEQK